MACLSQGEQNEVEDEVEKSQDAAVNADEPSVLEKRKDSSLAGLRLMALVALVIGAAGSIGLWIHAARHPPPVLIVLFVIWVLSPFLFLGAAHRKSGRWLTGTQVTLHIVTLFVAVVSIAVYADDAVAHRTAHPAAVYVLVPPISLLLSAIALGVAAGMAKRKQEL